MPHENMDHHEPHPEDMEAHKPMPKDEDKHDCGCGKNCPCRRKHMTAKLIAALLIFLAGFGAAMMCRCMSSSHHHKGCYAQQTCGKHSAMNLSGATGHTVIVNTDGHCRMIPQQPMQKAIKKYRPETKAQPMPMQNMAVMTDEDIDDEE